MYYVLLVVMSLLSGLCFKEYPKEKTPISLKNIMMLLQYAIEVSMITAMETGYNKDRKQHKNEPLRNMAYQTRYQSLVRN